MNPSKRASASSINKLLNRLISMKNERKDEEIASVMESEKRRGRRPRDAAAERLRKEQLGAVRELLHLTREEDFLGAIRALGRGDDPAALAAALKIWRDFSSSRKP